MESNAALKSGIASVAGLLGGFSITIAVLVLSPNPVLDGLGRDGLLAVLFLGAVVYVTSAAVLVNAISDPVASDPERNLTHYNLGVTLFHVGNTILATAMATLASGLGFPQAFIVTAVVAVLAAAVAGINGAIAARAFYRER